MRARAVVTAADARLVEFSAAGTVADRPFMIDFALRSREMRPAASATDSDFDIAPQPGDVVLEGNIAIASSNPMWDIVAQCARRHSTGAGPAARPLMAAEAIRAESLTKYYGAVVAVEDLDLAVMPGEVYGFLGPNGAGKTTTIRILLDLVRPTRGRIFVHGLDCRASSVAVRSRIGYLPAEMPLYRELTGGAISTSWGRCRQTPVDPQWLRRLLARFDVSETDLRRRLGDLSHGMKRKFGIVQALMGRAPLVVLDEPTSGLDPLMIEAFAETVHELKAEGRPPSFSRRTCSPRSSGCAIGWGLSGGGRWCGRRRSRTCGRRRRAACASSSMARRRSRRRRSRPR